MSDFKAKMRQIRFRRGLRPRPRWGAYSAPPNPLAGFKRPTSKGREGRGMKGDREEKEEIRKKGKGREGKGEGRGVEGGQRWEGKFRGPGGKEREMGREKERGGKI